jgi:hypothetical protein
MGGTRDGAAEHRLRRLPAPVRLDHSVGDESDNTASTTAFAKILDELKPPGLDYRFTVYRGENHNSVRWFHPRPDFTGRIVPPSRGELDSSE